MCINQLQNCGQSLKTVYQHQKTSIATFLAFWKIFELFLRNPAKIWPEPEPEPFWKILAELAGTGTGYPAHTDCYLTLLPQIVTPASYPSSHTLQLIVTNIARAHFRAQHSSLLLHHQLPTLSHYLALPLSYTVPLLSPAPFRNCSTFPTLFQCPHLCSCSEIGIPTFPASMRSAVQRRRK